MDLMTSLGQKNTLAEYMILSGADNRLPMLDKDMYDSWKSLPTDIYSLVNHHRVAKDLCDSGFAVPVFSPGDDPIACLNKAMVFLTVVASSRFPTTNNQLRTSLSKNHATIQDVAFTVQQDSGMTRPKIILGILMRAMLLSSRENTTSGQTRTEDLDTYDSDCDDLSTAQAVLMANISNYGSDVISKVPNSETYLNDMDNQSVHALQDFEQSPVMDFTDNEISSDSNIIPYSQYLQETQQATVQDTNLQAQQDSMILSVIEQILIEDFETRFSPQQELSAEQAFWFHTFNPTIEPSYSPPVIVDVPSELPKVESSNTSDSNTPVLSSTGVKCSTSNYGSKHPEIKRMIGSRNTMWELEE
ncbi:hypothetical protein Tco_0134970 [Tanacetum coccineum]